MTIERCVSYILLDDDIHCCENEVCIEQIENVTEAEWEIMKNALIFFREIMKGTQKVQKELYDKLVEFNDKCGN